MMLTKKLTGLLAGTLVCLLGTEALYAQQRGGGRGPQNRTRIELATLPEVQGELKLNDEQKQLAAELLTKLRELRQAGAQGNDSQADRAERTRRQAELNSQLVSKLDAPQNKRLNGLLLQVNGAASITDAAISETLGLTQDQRAKLRSTNQENQSARREVSQGLQNASQRERQEAMRKQTEKENEALLAVLTDEQRAKLEELKGANLTIDQAPLRQRRN
jgi:hypothetical protein